MLQTSSSSQAPHAGRIQAGGKACQRLPETVSDRGKYGPQHHNSISQAPQDSHGTTRSAHEAVSKSVHDCNCLPQCLLGLPFSHHQQLPAPPRSNPCLSPAVLAAAHQHFMHLVGAHSWRRGGHVSTAGRAASRRAHGPRYCRIVYDSGQRGQQRQRCSCWCCSGRARVA